MKLMNKTLLAIAIATVSTSSFAAWTTGVTTKNVIEEGAAADKATVAASANAVYTLAAGESLTANDTITIDIIGGATFTATTAQLTPSAGDLGAGAATASNPLSGGAAGSTSATWRATGAIAAAATLTLNSASNIFNVTNVLNGGNVDILITLKTSTGVVIGTASRSVKTDTTNYAFTGKKLFTLTTDTASNDEAKVAQGYKFFDNAGTNKVTSAALLTLTSNAAATSIPTQTVSAKKLVYTLAGDFNGVTSIAASGLEGDAAGLGAGGGTANQFTISADKKFAYAVNTGTIAAGAALTINDLKFTMDGTTAQPARSFTLKAELLADTKFSAHTIKSAANFVNITRDGTFFTTNSTGPINNIKITDQSGNLPAAGGAISVTAFDAAGAAVAPGATVIPTTVNSNATVILPGADLIAKFPNAVRFDVTVNSTDAAISNIKKDATGISSSFYRQSSKGGAL